MHAPKISPFPPIYWLQIVFLYLSLLFLIPQGVLFYPIVVPPGLILLAIAYIRRKSIQKVYRQLRKKKNYPDKNISLNTAEMICFISVLCSFYCLMASVTFYFSSSLQSPIIFLLTIIFCIYLLIHYYIAYIDPESSVFVKTFFKIIKFSWVLITAYSYVVTRKSVMELIDIPYEKTISMTTTLGLAAVKYTYYYCVFFIVVIIILSAFGIKTKRIPSRWNTRIMQKSPNRQVFTLLIFVGCVVWLIYTLTYSAVVESVFSRTVPLDSRTSFYCHDRYMIVNENPDASYIFISEGDYRMAIQHDNQYTFSRLKCTDSVPYYTIIPVKNATVLIADGLAAKLALLQGDIRKVTAGK